MGAGCCKRSVVSDHHSDKIKDDIVGPSSERHSDPTVAAASDVDIVSVHMEQGESSNTNASIKNIDDEKDSYKASNTLWTTRSFSDPIPNGFYSVIPTDSLKQLFENIPKLDTLRTLGDEEGLRADVILIDFENDKYIKRLKPLIKTSVEGVDSLSAIKNIAELVVDNYERKKWQTPPYPQSFESRNIQLVGEKHDSFRARAILFKILADHVGIKNKLVVGFPFDPKSSESVNRHDHMYVVVEINNMEMMVDLRQLPCQLIRLLSYPINIGHIPALGRPSQSEPDLNTDFWMGNLTTSTTRQLRCNSFHGAELNNQRGEAVGAA